MLANKEESLRLLRDQVSSLDWMQQGDLVVGSLDGYCLVKICFANGIICYEALPPKGPRSFCENISSSWSSQDLAMVVKSWHSSVLRNCRDLRYPKERDMADVNEGDISKMLETLKNLQDSYRKVSISTQCAKMETEFPLLRWREGVCGSVGSIEGFFMGEVTVRVDSAMSPEINFLLRNSGWTVESIPRNQQPDVLLGHLREWYQAVICPLQQDALQALRIAVPRLIWRWEAERIIGRELNGKALVNVLHDFSGLRVGDSLSARNVMTLSAAVVELYKSLVPSEVAKWPLSLPSMARRLAAVAPGVDWVDRVECEELVGRTDRDGPMICVGRKEVLCWVASEEEPGAVSAPYKTDDESYELIVSWLSKRFPEYMALQFFVAREAEKLSAELSAKLPKACVTASDDGMSLAVELFGYRLEYRHDSSGRWSQNGQCLSAGDVPAHALKCLEEFHAAQVFTALGFLFPDVKWEPGMEITGRLANGDVVKVRPSIEGVEVCMPTDQRLHPCVADAVKAIRLTLEEVAPRANRVMAWSCQSCSRLYLVKAEAESCCSCSCGKPRSVGLSACKECSEKHIAEYHAKKLVEDESLQRIPRSSTRECRSLPILWCGWSARPSVRFNADRQLAI